MIRFCLEVKSQRTKKVEVFSQGTDDSKNLRCADWELRICKHFQFCCVWYKAMAGRRWRLEQKLSFIFIQIHSVESSKLIKNVIIFKLELHIQHSKLENFCIFVISNNKSLISQNLEVVGPLGRKFDFVSPSGFEIQSVYLLHNLKNQVLLCQSFEVLSE